MHSSSAPKTRKSSATTAKTAKTAKTTKTTKTAKTVAKPASPQPSDGKAIVIRAAVFNIMDNVQYVLDACNCKTVMPAHLKAVAMIQNTISRNHIGKLPAGVKKPSAPRKRAVTGGAQVMAPQFFGVDDGRYFDISQVEQLETHMFADAALSRAEMPLKIGGGGVDSGAVTKTALKKAIKDYNAEKNKATKVSAEALEMMRASVEQNLKEVTAKVGGNFTTASVKELSNTDPTFAHLAV